MESSILDSIGTEIVGVMSPVSICMLLVVLIVYSLYSSAAAATPIRTAANLVYMESPSDSVTQKLEGSLLNALVFVVFVAVVTFLLVVLYYYNFTNFLKNYMRFSAFFVLATMGGSVFLSLVQTFSVPVDSVSCFLLLFNFSVVGVLSLFSAGFPILLRQAYMVSLGVFVATWFTKLPEWTTWTLLVALALYDLVAVLAPGGPLKLLVELASSRDEELPALVYEARPTVSRELENRGSPLRLLATTRVSDAAGSIDLQPISQDNSRIRTEEEEEEGGGDSPSHFVAVEVRNFANERGVLSEESEEERSPLVLSSMGRRSSSSDSSPQSNQANVVPMEEMSPLVELMGMGNEREVTREGVEIASRGIKLGLGDFIFYSVLVGRAAMYDLMTVYACYLAIICGLGCTLILLSVYRKALPALPISIALGVLFYFLTRILMEPFIVGSATNLLMF